MKAPEKRRKLVVVGLGNPGREYEGTPHNAGFAVVERLAEEAEGTLRRSWRYEARKARIVLEESNVILAEPLSFMNNSGSVVAALLRAEGLKAENLLVISDDADLEIGRIRIREAGGSGGHKGMQSIIASVGTDSFPRIRVGIGRGDRAQDLVRFVLSPFSGAERAQMKEVFQQTAEAVRAVVRDGIAAAMNRFNGLQIGQANG